jgi:hypothetical protein
VSVQHTGTVDSREAELRSKIDQAREAKVCSHHFHL